MATRDRSAQTYLHLHKLSFPHPEHRRIISLVNKPPESFKGAVQKIVDVERPLHAALVRRTACLVDSGTNCYRLLTGPSENRRGLIAERYGNVIILEIRDRQAISESEVQRAAKWYGAVLGAKAVYAKDCYQQSDEFSDNGPEARLIFGDRPPGELVVMERGLKYLVKPITHAAAGLFLDQRDNRSRIRKLAQNSDVLNLFAYTCGFSLAAAAGNASATVSVDLSPRHLEWGERNFALNGLTDPRHEFFQSDAQEYLKRASRQGRQFDVVIIDAPTFAHGRKRGQSFFLARDLPDLIRMARQVMRPGASMLIGTNNRRLTSKKFKQLIIGGFGRARREKYTECNLPVDFAADRDHSKVVLVTMGMSAEIQETGDDTDSLADNPGTDDWN